MVKPTGPQHPNQLPQGTTSSQSHPKISRDPPTAAEAAASKTNGCFMNTPQLEIKGFSNTKLNNLFPDKTVVLLTETGAPTGKATKLSSTNKTTSFVASIRHLVSKLFTYKPIPPTGSGTGAAHEPLLTSESSPTGSGAGAAGNKYTSEGPPLAGGGPSPNFDPKTGRPNNSNAQLWEKRKKKPHNTAANAGGGGATGSGAGAGGGARFDPKTGKPVAGKNSPNYNKAARKAAIQKQKSGVKPGSGAGAGGDAIRTSEEPVGGGAAHEHLRTSDPVAPTGAADAAVYAAADAAAATFVNGNKEKGFSLMAVSTGKHAYISAKQSGNTDDEASAALAKAINTRQRQDNAQRAKFDPKTGRPIK